MATQSIIVDFLISFQSFNFLRLRLWLRISIGPAPLHTVRLDTVRLHTVRLDTVRLHTVRLDQKYTLLDYKPLIRIRKDVLYLLERLKYAHYLFRYVTNRKK